jgi:hypothetical protein
MMMTILPSNLSYDDTLDIFHINDTVYPVTEADPSSATESLNMASPTSCATVLTMAHVEFTLTDKLIEFLSTTNDPAAVLSTADNEDCCYIYDVLALFGQANCFLQQLLTSTILDGASLYETFQQLDANYHDIHAVPLISTIRC